MPRPGEHPTVPARLLAYAHDVGWTLVARDEAAYWGKTIGVAYGEPLTCREPIGLSSLRELV